MEIFKKMWAVARMNFCHWLKDIRVQFVFICMACMVVYYVMPVTKVGLSMGKTSTPFILPALMKEGNVSIGTPKIVLSIGMLLLFCDAPFWNPVSPYMVIRSKRRGWWMGECLYIVMAAFFYVLFLTVLSTAVLIPVASLSDDWGSAIRYVTFEIDKLSFTELIEYNETYKIFVMPSRSVVQYLYPLQTQIYCMVAMWGCYSMLGLLIYLISLKSRSISFGMGIAAVLVFLDPLMIWCFGMNRHSKPEFLLSPVSWMSPENLDLVHRANCVSMPYALGMYVLLCLLLIALISRCSKRTEINFVAD